MDGQLVHFELPAEDAGRAKEFWKSLFGWKFREWSGPVEYHMLEGIEPGGAIYPSEEQAGQGPIVYLAPPTSTPRSRGLASSAARPTRSRRFRRLAGSLAAATRKGTSSPCSRPTSRCPLQARAYGEQPGRIEELELGCGRPRIAFATSSPHARPMTLPWPE